ncbi:hypothetical protein H2O64_11080 [Kordia sp. YSTF-M3]|uniref:Uncharacterized protein n=1 Tax=Kordia aestuariivivens TaxID=2759037 RepID=A0ABR7Q9H2_9FLAO|nr:hypothetical protein [Kordia aestuariivivens]MBC8755219.1 hypothetical protein [Kordia aestuariivivens]
MNIDTIANIKFDKKIINYLSVLKPAATAILLAPTETDLKDIIQYTTMDLTLKKVLSIQHKNIRLHPSDPYERARTIVETDKNFATYRKSIYESYFLGIINEQSYFQLYSYLLRIYHELPLDNKVKKSILKEHKILNLFSFSFTFDSFSIFRLNRNGEKVRNEIQRYFVTIEENLPHIIENSPLQVLHLLSFLKGNFFLLKNISVELLEKINALIKLHKEEVRDEYFDLFDLFEFSDIFLSGISEEIGESMQTIERTYNRGNPSTDNVYDPTDFSD